MATLLNVNRNTGPPYELTLKRRNGKSLEVINLSSVSTVELVIQNQATGENTTNGYSPATITNPTAGIISYSAAPTDFPEQGTYVADVRLTYADGTEEVLYDQQKFKTRDRIVVD